MPLPQREKLRSVYKTTTDSQNQMKEPPPQWLAERRKCPSNGRLGSSGPRPPGAVLSNDFSHIWCTGWIIRLDFGSRIWIGEEKETLELQGASGNHSPCWEPHAGPPPSSAVLPLLGAAAGSAQPSSIMCPEPEAHSWHDRSKPSQASPILSAGILELEIGYTGRFLLGSLPRKTRFQG